MFDAGQFAGLKASPGGQALADLEVFDWPAAPEVGRCWSSASDQFQLAVQARRPDLQALTGAVSKREKQPCVVLRWAAEDPILSDGDRRRLWQQWWQAANLLMPIGNAWAVADVGCDLAALKNSPTYQASSDMTSEWESAAAIAASSVQALLAGLFEAGISAPEVGYELMGSDGCVAADCELAWPGRKVAVLLASGGESAFAAAGWKGFLADESSLLNTLIGLLKQA